MFAPDGQGGLKFIGEIKMLNVKEFTEQELTSCYKCINKLDVSEAVVKKIKEQLQREMMKLKQIDFFEE